MTTEIMIGLFVGSVVSGIAPFVNAELMVVAAAAALPEAAIPLVAAVSAGGQMATKTAVYGVARWIPARLPTRARAALAAMSDRLARRTGALVPLVFISASVGLPPFYGVSLACGALRVRLSVFVGLGLLGRAVRFLVLAYGGHQGGQRLAEAAFTAWPWGGGVLL
jgi:membrane protein YqaA with SNARE-associated domain